MIAKLKQAWRSLTTRVAAPRPTVEVVAIAAASPVDDAARPDVTASDTSPDAEIDGGTEVDPVAAIGDAPAEPVAAEVEVEPELPPLPPVPDVDATVEGLTLELRRRTVMLANEIQSPDAHRLLEDLAASPTAVIRQLPAAAQRALALTQLTDPPIARLTEVFEEDPTLAQALLAQANSGLFGAGRPCLSVRDALQRLGVQAARNVLLGHTVSALLCRPGGTYAAMVDDVWSHMVRTAPIARRVASAFNADAEEAFGLGLLHDIGKLVVFDRLTTLRIEIRRELVIAPADLSRILRAVHEPLGGLAAHSWSLGLGAAEAIATHHRDPVPAVRNSLSEVLCVAEAADLADVNGQEFDLAALWDRARLGGSAVRVERALLAS